MQCRLTSANQTSRSTFAEAPRVSAEADEERDLYDSAAARRFQKRRIANRRGRSLGSFGVQRIAESSVVRGLDAEPLRAVRVAAAVGERIHGIPAGDERLVEARRRAAADSGSHVSRVPLRARRDGQAELHRDSESARRRAHSRRRMDAPDADSRRRDRRHSTGRHRRCAGVRRTSISPTAIASR